MDDEDALLDEHTKLLVAGSLFSDGYFYDARKLLLQREVSIGKKDLNKYTDPSVREQITKKINLKEQELFTLMNRPRTEESLDRERGRVRERGIAKAYVVLKELDKYLARSIKVLAVGFIFLLVAYCTWSFHKTTSIVAFLIGFFPVLIGLPIVCSHVSTRISTQNRIKELNNS